MGSKDPIEGRLRAKTLSSITLSLVLTAVAPAWAASAIRIKVDAGPLPNTLREIARQTGADLLFDPKSMAGLRAEKIDTRTTPMAALQTALLGTDFTTRRLSSGALIVERPAAPPMEQQDVTVSEILIVGRRSQNADIRREETDIQRYRVTTSDELVGAHVDTIGQFFDTRVPPNANAFPSGAVAGSTYSRIDLRGLGADQTLVLIDGRRMPRFIAAELVNAFGFQQPDISAVPLHAVDRIETLTGTAGGIYGFGALGGVVNIVLGYDRPGADAHLTTGLSSRGDAGHYALEGRLQYSPDHGATTVTINAALSRFQRLRVGQRGYLERDRRETLRVDPSNFLLLIPPYGNSVAAYSAYEGDLVLKPGYGGAALAATYSYVPVGFEGTPSELATVLVKNAGQLDLGLSRGEAQSDLIPKPELGSLLVNVRRQFGDGGVEGYFDGILLWNRTEYINRGLASGDYLPSDSPSNPFEQGILVHYPIENDLQTMVTHYDSSRFTIGLLAPMPHAWRSTAEFSWGSARFKEDRRETFASTLEVEATPFGSWNEFQQVLFDSLLPGRKVMSAETRYREASLRFGGPVLEALPGRSTLTLLVEGRREAVPAFTVEGSGGLTYSGGDIAPFSTTMSSFSAELRSAPFRKRSSGALSSLEVQLAVRHDRQSNHFSSPPTDLGSPRVHVDLAGTSYTAGAKVYPASWLMLRGSYATGQTAPPLPNLVSLESEEFYQPADPKRPGATDYTGFLQKYGGSADLKSIRASTAAVGFMVTPWGPEGPSLSLDYSRIRRTNDVEYMSYFTVLEHEDEWPERVQRAPLTDEDQALGYTGGVITMIDHTAVNGARRDVETLDTRFVWPLKPPLGVLRLYGEASYNLKNKRTSLFEDPVDINGYYDGPLVWRANGGVEWSLGSLTMGANLQHYDSYRVQLSGTSGSNIFSQLQGSNRVAAQTYLDLRLHKRFQTPEGAMVRGVNLDFGVNNVLDAAPPRLITLLSSGKGASPYGDPRCRRVELTISAAF